MTIDEMTAILRIRRDLTGESFNDGTIEAWCEALNSWSPVEARTALIAAAREHTRVGIAHVSERLPRRSTPSIPPARCELCDGTGWISVPPERVHNPRTCSDDPCLCHAVAPCRCSSGQDRADVHQRALELNERSRPSWMRHPDHEPYDDDEEQLDNRLTF